MKQHVYRRPHDYLPRGRRNESWIGSKAPSGVLARRFDGIDDHILASVGTATLTGNYTIAWLGRKLRDTQLSSLSAPFNTTDAAGGNLGHRTLLTTVGALQMAHTLDVETAPTLRHAEHDWIIYAVTGNAGSTAIVRFHLWTPDGGWQHEDSGTTVGPIAATPDLIEFGSRFNAGIHEKGDVAVVGAWNSQLSDGSIETLSTNWRTQDWFDLSPAGLWDFGQDSVGTPVTDITGNGADQTSIAGTTVIDDGPAGWIYGAAAPTVQLGQALETDTAHALTLQKAIPLGLPTETDTAHAITLQKTVALGVATEIDTSQPLTLQKTVPLGQPSEADTALPLTVRPRVALGQATETDSALGVTLRKTVRLGVATETDQALPITVIVEGAEGESHNLPILHVGT